MLKRIWKAKTGVISILIGALGIITTRYKSFRADLGNDVSF